MDKTGSFNLRRLAVMALYVAGAWASLAILLFAGAWQPQEPFEQSSRVIVLVGAGVALMMCVIGATARLVSSAAAAVPDPDPKP
jgi:NhaP-type Na+/H+ or K+/H+ antiporter